MMKSLYHFLGGIKFAIFLITTTALFVIVGTFIESKTDSHALAAKFTYDSFLFNLLIFGFFINILFSATRRWPFKKKHIPFLITHLGLLMILSGMMIKTSFGTQGVMSLMEGSGTDQIFLRDTYALLIEEEQKKQIVDLKQLKTSGLNLKLIDQYPHSVETLETFVKGSFGFIYGYPPFPLNDSAAKAPKSIKASLTNQYPDFELIGFNAETEQAVFDIAKKTYLKDLIVSIKDRKTGFTLYEEYLETILEKKIVFNDVEAKFFLDFDFSPFLGFSESSLKISFLKNHKKSQEVLVPLFGKSALINHNLTTPFLGNSPFIVELKANPTLLFIQDNQEDIFLLLYDKDGRVYSELFPKGRLNSYVAYNKGFHGYSVQTTLALNTLSREEIELEQIKALKNSLKEAVKANITLSHPLQLLKDACAKENLDFTNILAGFLDAQDQAHQMIYDGDFNLPKLNIETLSISEQKSIAWLSTLLPTIAKKIEEGLDFIEILEAANWPYVEKLKDIKNNLNPKEHELSVLFEALSAQIYMLGHQLPELEPVSQNAFFSALLRAFGLNLTSAVNNNLENRHKEIQIECPLTKKHEKCTPGLKLEDHLPYIKLKLNNEIIALTYDRFGTGLKWPTKDGKYTLRFQPFFKTLPFRLRLQNARQIHYPNSNSNYSFEADLIVTDIANARAERVTISMNHVHETWDGYRFYLSNITPGSETDIQHVQIVVNHDPAKYFLTYPGAIVLSIGIILLFWFIPK